MNQKVIETELSFFKCVRADFSVFFFHARDWAGAKEFLEREKENYVELYELNSTRSGFAPPAFPR